MRGTLYTLILFFYYFLLPATTYSQEGAHFASVMFYNVENLYDPVDDTLRSDEEFSPEGGKRWGYSRMYKKLTAISKVVANTGSWEPPAVIGFCEVENRQVLERLVNMPALKKWNYSIIHKESPDTRGIDVAAIYRQDLFLPLSYRYFSPLGLDEKVSTTREILHLSGLIGGKDTLDLFFNHWPSRYGGLMETRPSRRRAALRLRAEVDTLQQSSETHLIIIMGDFNDQPNDESLLKYLRANSRQTGRPESLVNLSFAWLKGDSGTLKYRSQWNIFDQIIVNERLLDKHSSMFVLPGDAEILDASFLMERDEKYGGSKLNRTYTGYQYHGGFSDHLPVILRLRR